MSGFTLVDCPTRNEKETLDKKIIVDVMQFAHSRVMRRQATCVILISNDGDYAYMLSRLRDIQVQAVCIFDGEAAKVLLHSCDQSLSWRYDVLRLPAPKLADQLAQDADCDSFGGYFSNLLATYEEGQRRQAKGTPWEVFAQELDGRALLHADRFNR